MIKEIPQFASSSAIKIGKSEINPSFRLNFFQSELNFLRILQEQAPRDIAKEKSIAGKINKLFNCGLNQEIDFALDFSIITGVIFDRYHVVLPRSPNFNYSFKTRLGGYNIFLGLVQGRVEEPWKRESSNDKWYIRMGRPGEKAEQKLEEKYVPLRNLKILEAKAVHVPQIN